MQNGIRTSTAKVRYADPMGDRPRRPAVRKRRGRPVKARANARSERVTFFVTPPEYEKLVRLAEKSDRSLSHVVYEFVAKALKRRR